MPKKISSDFGRDDVIQAAFRVIARQGVSAASVREVGREAGCSPGAVVHYFKPQDQLLTQVADYSAAVVRERTVAMEKKFTGVEAIRRAIWETIPLDEERRGHWRIWMGFIELAPEKEAMRNMIQSRYAEATGRFSSHIRYAIRNGEIPGDVDVKLAAESAVAFVDSMGIQAVVNPNGLTPARQRKHVNFWISNTLRPFAK